MSRAGLLCSGMGKPRRGSLQHICRSVEGGGRGQSGRPSAARGPHASVRTRAHTHKAHTCVIPCVKTESVTLPETRASSSGGANARARAPWTFRQAYRRKGPSPAAAGSNSWHTADCAEDPPADAAGREPEGARRRAASRATGDLPPGMRGGNPPTLDNGGGAAGGGGTARGVPPATGPAPRGLWWRPAVCGPRPEAAAPATALCAGADTGRCGMSAR